MTYPDAESVSQSYPIPPQIRRAAKLGELVVFVGAGVSALCDSPRWDEFANAIVDQIAKRIGLSFLEREQLKSISDPRRKASIAVDLADAKGVHIDFPSILHPQTPASDGQAIYQILAAMNPVFVTTNYDHWLEVIPPAPSLELADRTQNESSSTPDLKRQVYCWPEEFTVEKLNERGAVIHLHGSCKHPDSMVISLRDYINHYDSEHVKLFLKEVFEKRTVLFIGYGVAELEILEFIVRYAKLMPAIKGIPQQHYLLYSYRSTEETQLRFLEQFFNDQCGIGVVPYCIDRLGFSELLEVLRQWRGQLDVRKIGFIDSERMIDEAIAQSESLPRRQSAINMIRDDSALADYFFSKATDSIWLNDLCAAGFFSTENNASPTLSKDGKFYEPVRWPALTYLERIAANLQDGDEDISRQILSIVSDVTIDAEARAIDNWLTWWSLANCLANIPVSLINASHIQLVRIWLSSKYDSGAVGHVLGEVLLPKLLESPSAEHAPLAADLLDVLTMKRGEPANG